MTLQERINAAKRDNRPLSGHSAKQNSTQTATKAPGKTGGQSGAGQGTGTAGMSLQERINAAKRDSRPLGWQGTDTTEGKLNATPVARPTDPLRSRTTSLVQSLSTPLTEQMQNNEGAKLRRMDELERQLKQTETEKRLLDLETPYGAAKLPKGWGDPGGVNRRGDELTKKQSDLQNELDTLSQDMASARWLKKNMEYEALRGNADFAEKSRYNSTRKSEEEIEASKRPLAAALPQLDILDYGDITYDAINRDPEARNKATTGKAVQYTDLDDDKLKMFNYLYATRGPESAYQYLDDMAVGQKFFGDEALALGMYNATGLPSVGALLVKGISTVTGNEDLDRQNEEWYGDWMRDASQAQKQHPVAYGTGTVAGNLSLLSGIGAGLGAAEGALAAQMAPAVRGVVNSSLSFLTADAVRNAGAVATGYMAPGDYLKSVGSSGVQGLAGGLAGGLVGSGMASVLRETGMMTPFMEFVRQSVSGFASAGANIGTGYLLSEEKPSNEQIATDLATAFLFSIIQGGISTYKTTQATKTQMDAALNEIVRRYGQMSQSWETMTPEARVEAASYIMDQTESLRRSLNSTYMAGQQSTVDRLDQCLNGITQGMQWYINNFQTYQSATTAPGNMLGSGAYGSGTGAVAVPAGPTGGSELAWVQSQLQTALSQGIAQGQNVTPAGIVPAGAVGALSGQVAGSRPYEGATDESALQAIWQAAMEMHGGEPGTGTPGAEMPTEEQEMAAAKRGTSRGETASIVHKLAESVPDLADMLPVSVVTTEALQAKGGKTMAERARGLFEAIKGTVTRAGFGDVTIDTRSVKDDLSHGIGAAKAAVIPAIPHVIQQGRQIDLQENWKGRKYDGYVFAAPVTMDGKPVYVAAVVKQSSKNRFYLHEVVDSNGNIIKMDSGAGANPTSLAAESDAGTPLPLSTDSIPDGGDGVNSGTVAFGREAVERFTKDLSPALATTLREMYNETQEPAAYLEDMMRAHKAGREGITDPRAVFGPQMENAHITLFQAQAAMLAGRNNGGTEYEQGAETVRVRNGGQRADGAHPGGQVRELEGGAGQDQGGDLQGRPADAGAAALAHGRKVSTASLGIGGGSDSDGIYIVNRGADTPATAAARKLARERGLRLTLFVGNNLSIKKGSAYASVRGYVSGDRVFIRADHPEYTADQIMRHEAGHDMIAKGEVDPNTVRERIQEKFGAEKADRLAGLYEAAYRGTGLTSSEVWEETICDSLGDMNIFSDTVHEGEVQEFLEEVKKAASAEQETRRNRGPPQGKTSMETSMEQSAAKRYGLAEDETAALLTYKSSESYKVNAKLRDGLSLTSEEQKMVSALDKALEKLPKVKGTVYRTVSFDDLSDADVELAIFLAEHKEGNTVVYPAYTSTSTRLDGYPLSAGTKFGAVLEITGENARLLDGFGNNFEYEALFPRDTVFHIATIEQDDDGIYHMQMKEDAENAGEGQGRVGSHSQERSENVQRVQEKGQVLGDLQGVSETDTLGSSEERLPGVRGDGGEVSGDKAKFSMELPVEEYTEQEKKDHAAAALAHFGRTFSWKETAYLTQDGKKIDFSGRNEGAPGGSRTLDHRDIRDALGLDYGGEDYSGAMVQFMAEGNIRIMPESSGINLSVLPTKAQEEALDDFISRARGEVTLDIDTPGGDTVVSVEYPRGTRGSKVLNDIRQYFEAGIVPQVSEVSRYHFSQELEGIEKLREEFRQDLATWNKEGRPTGESFILGSTGPVLQGLGAIESDIYMEGDKINTILHDHPEMTLREIQRIPDILENPVLVLKSNGSSRAGQNTRLVLFGSVKAQNGQPVMCVLDLRPVEGRFVIQDMQKVNSSYTRDNALNYVQSSEIMHADKKRAIPLLRSIGLHGPIELQQNGSMGSITYKQRSVNLSGVPFSEVVKAESGGEYASQELPGIEALRREDRRLAQQARKEGWSDARLRQERLTAAEKVFQYLIEEYGAIPAGESPARSVQVPRRTSGRERVSQTVRTILEAKATPGSAIPSIQELVVKGEFSYETVTDKEAIARAERTITDRNWGSALAEWKKDMAAGKVSKDHTAMGWALYNNAANSGNLEMAMDILQEMVKSQRSAAQALQATRILKQLSPEAQLYGVVQSVEGLQKELNERYGETDAPELKIDEDLGRRLLEARTQEERDAALRDIYRDIGRQMPSRLRDKWNAWRYLSMLGNPRTHVRNIVGNAGFAPVVMAKDLVATAIEKAVSAVSGGGLERSKALVGLGKADRALLSAAWADYASVEEAALGGGKYSDLQSANRYIEEGRVIFRGKAAGKALETARKANSYALDVEDIWFSKPHYAYALAQFCKAHKITEAEIRRGNPQVLAAARNYAVKEAQKATYRDANALSQTVSRLGRDMTSGKNPVSRGLGVLAEGILPFRKTPANILARGLEYSPLGLLKGLGYDLGQVRRGNMTGAEAIDNISAGLTGTGLLALGLYLAAQGLVRGRGKGDDKERELAELQGHQNYSMELPDGRSITLDWLAPEALPFFVGVNLWEVAQDGEGNVTLAQMLEAVGNVSEPMLEMSCLQSLNDALEVGGRVSSDGLGVLPAVLVGAASSYLTQGLPTLLGQLERVTEKERESTYTEKNAFLTPDMQYTLGKVSGKVPGWEFQQIPYIDAWGRHESNGGVGARAFHNLLNPAYTSQIEESPMEQELLRLYRETGETGVLPKRAAKTVVVNGQARDLTAKEYVRYAEQRGQVSLKLVTALTESKLYAGLEDAVKAECVVDAYTYANQVARSAIDNGANMDAWVTTARQAEEAYRLPVATYILLRNGLQDIGSLKDKNGEAIDNSRGLLIMQKIYEVKGLNDEQRRYLFEAFGVGKSVSHYNRTAVEEALERMVGG